MDSGSGGRAPVPDVDVEAGDRRIGALVAAMSLTEKASLLSGADIWRLAGLPRLGIPELVMSDGPAGVRGGSFLSGRSVSFPCETALAASWDPDLVASVGDALGREARSKGVHVLLAPTVNLHRHPLAGRNFECFSEDPHLSARMAVAYIRGVQSNRVACCLKHFVCNDSEFMRHTISSEVDETTLREMYLLPFEEGAKAGVWSIMASYNRLNGTHTSEHPWLLDRVLRDEWAWDGVVVSDWFATHSTVEALDAGLDVEMPGPSRFRGAELVVAVDEGAVSEATLDRSVARVLKLIDRTAGIGQATTSPVGERHNPESLRVLVRKAAARCMVLLKNERGVLPIRPPEIKTVALIGPGADLGTFQGGGSAQVNPPQVSAILPALSEALGSEVQISFERGCVTSDWPQPLCSPLITTPSGEPGAQVSYHLVGDPTSAALSVETARQMQLVFIGDVVEGHGNDEVLIRTTADIHPAESGTGLISLAGTGTVRLHMDQEFLAEGTWQAQGSLAFDLGGNAVRLPLELSVGVPRRIEVEFRPSAAKGLTRMEICFTPPDPSDGLERAVASARSADVAVVVAESPQGWESEGRDRTTMTLPGAQDQLIASVAAVNRNTVVVINAGAPIAMPWVDEVAAVLVMWLPGQEAGSSLADVLSGAVNPSGRLPTTFYAGEQDVPSAAHYPGSDGKVSYGERFNFGYRHKPAGEAPKPLFAFGHGLSYSRFELGPPKVDMTDEAGDTVYQVTVPVSHVSGPAGRQVVQVYISPGRPDGPAIALQGFGSVDLEPGETRPVCVAIPRMRLRTWTEAGWELPTLPLRGWVGTSAADLLHELELPAPDVETDGRSMSPRKDRVR